MQLPFTKEQFFDLLAAYNVGLWPALLALWIASVLVSVTAALVAPAVRSVDQCPPRRALGLVRAGVSRGVLYPHQPGRLGVRGAVPSAGRGVLLGGSRPRALVVCPLAQRLGAGGMGARRVLARISGDQRGSTSECGENSNLRSAVPDDDFHGRHVDARHATFVAPVDRSCDLVSHRRIRGVPPGCTRRLRPPARRHCIDDLLDPEDQRQLGIAKRVESVSAGDRDISKG